MKKCSDIRLVLTMATAILQLKPVYANRATQTLPAIMITYTNKMVISESILKAWEIKSENTSFHYERSG